MPRVVHFEFAVDDPARAQAFYEGALGWKISKWDGPQDYWLIATGPDSEPGIHGALMRRDPNFPNVINTVDVASVDDTVAAVLAHGGEVAIPKMSIPGIGWLAYVKDTEGNLFGLMASDPSVV